MTCFRDLKRSIRSGCFRPTTRSRRSRHGFTIIELLAATAVLSLLVVLLLSIINSTLQSSKIVNQQIDATQGARRALDAISSDIVNAVVSNSATILCQSYEGAPSLAFLTNGRGPSAAQTSPRYLAVNYRLENRMLTRSYQSVGWGSANLLAAAETAAPNALGSSSLSGGRSILSTGILQFSASAVLENGSRVSLLTTPSTAWGASGSVLYHGLTVPTGWTALVPATKPLPDPLTDATSRVRSIVFAVAAIDSQNQKLLEESTTLPIFAQPSGALVDPVPQWESSLAAASVPNSVRSSIRFLTKTVQLP